MLFLFFSFTRSCSLSRFGCHVIVDLNKDTLCQSIRFDMVVALAFNYLSTTTSIWMNARGREREREKEKLGLILAHHLLDEMLSSRRRTVG